VIRNLAERRLASGYVAELRRQLLDGELDEEAEALAPHLPGDRPPVDALDADLDEIMRQEAGPESYEGDEDGPFVTNDPIVGVLLSSLESGLEASGRRRRTREDNLWSHVADAAEEHLYVNRRTVDKVRRTWKATLKRLSDDYHDFSPEPAEADLGDDARVVVVGDWGSGDPRARLIAEMMAHEVEAAEAAGRPVHVIHLGEVYHSGLTREYEENVPADSWWPVKLAQAQTGSIKSWALPGNHDMYSGGGPYFKTMLGDDRFRWQRSGDGSQRPTS
jgi:hypothetical protein